MPQSLKLQLLAAYKSLLALLIKQKEQLQPSAIQPKIQRLADLVIQDLLKEGHNCMIYEGFRSFEEQDSLYAQGRTTPGTILTNAKGGQSFHNYGVAVDIVFLVNGKPSWSEGFPWSEIGRIGKSYGFEWGGDWASFPDRPHLQYTAGYTLADFQNGTVDYSLFK